jgi:ubiquitin-like protein ATG12
MDQEGEDVKKETSSEDSKTESPSEEEQNTDSSESPSSNVEKTKEDAEEKKPLVVRKPSSEPQTKAPAKGGKVEVRLQAAGDAPIMKQKNYKVDGEKQINWIIAFIRKYLKLEEKDHLFLYVNQSFSPSPDQTVNNLAECFGADGKLVLYYSRSQAWG